MSTARLQPLFGENLARIRLSRSLSQGDISRNTSIRRETISRLEHGTMEPSGSVVAEIAKFLCVSMDALCKPAKKLPKIPEPAIDG